MSASQAKYVVILEGETFEPHICGVFHALAAAVKCVEDDHVDTGAGLQNYRIEVHRGRQFLGIYNHEGILMEVSRAGE